MIWSVALIFVCFSGTFAKIDNITLKHDDRSKIDMVSFGMYMKAYMNVSVELHYSGVKDCPNNRCYGFTLDKTTQSSNQISNMGEKEVEKSNHCALADDSTIDGISDRKNTILFWFSVDENNKEGRLTVKKNSGVLGVRVSTQDITAQVDTPDNATVGSVAPKGSTSNAPQDNSTVESPPARRRREVETEDSKTDRTEEGASTTVQDTGNGTDSQKTVLQVGRGIASGAFDIHTKIDDDITVIRAQFAVHITTEKDQGMYSLYFHNCNTDAETKKMTPIDLLRVNITAQNQDPVSYLSAGQIPEPYLYFAVCLTYFALSFVWIKVLRTANSGVFKTHYLMLTVLYCKSLSGLFHGVNYLYISREGKEETAWAVLYYITYLMKTLMLFLTLLLVGTGWSFVKHIFSDKEKKLFLVAIPFQVLFYVAFVITSETETATKNWSTWHALSLLVDILCSVTILAPVYWSIRHLTEASRTNGKAAINLQKLQLFRTLYALIICNIYVSKIVIFIIKMTLPFQLEWLGDALTETTILMFLLIVGYKFRPADDNPYFQIPPDSDDEENIEMPITQSGVNSSTKRRVVVNAEDETEEQSLLPNRSKNESSHELD